MTSKIQISKHCSSVDSFNYSLVMSWIVDRDVLFEYHPAVVTFSWAVRPVRGLSTL